MIWHFMQIVFLGDNLHECQVLFPEKNISIYRLLKILHRELSVKAEKRKKIYLFSQTRPL